jgi:hypothetical protein
VAVEPQVALEEPPQLQVLQAVPAAVGASQQVLHVPAASLVPLVLLHQTALHLRVVEQYKQGAGRGM